MLTLSLSEPECRNQFMWWRALGRQDQASPANNCRTHSSGRSVTVITSLSDMDVWHGCVTCQCVTKTQVRIGGF